MIPILFLISKVEKKLEVEFPAVPSVGDQIYLADFIDEGDSITLREAGVNVDGLFVQNITWMQNERVYAVLMLE